MHGDQGFILPHEWFAYLYKNFNGVFTKLFMGAKTTAQAKRKLVAFWGTIKESDPRRHALRPGFPKDSTIPGWIHGDGVPCTKHEGLEHSSWGSMLSKWMWFSSGYFKKVVHMVPRSGNQANDTKKVFVKILNWSFRALAMGKFPDTDWQGKAWPAGSRGDKIKNTDLAGGS